jgi:hypothetical protein
VCVCVYVKAGCRSPHSLGDALLCEQRKGAGLGGGVEVGAAAELDREGQVGGWGGWGVRGGGGGGAVDKQQRSPTGNNGAGGAKRGQGER